MRSAGGSGGWLRRGAGGRVWCRLSQAPAFGARAMGLPSLVRPAAFACLVAGALAASTACHTCGLGQHDRVVVSESPVPCCGGFVFKDLALMGRTSGAEFELVNAAKPTQPGSVDDATEPADDRGGRRRAATPAPSQNQQRTAEAQSNGAHPLRIASTENDRIIGAVR